MVSGVAESLGTAITSAVAGAGDGIMGVNAALGGIVVPLKNAVVGTAVSASPTASLPPSVKP